METYVDERNRLVKLTKAQFDLLPESKQNMLKIYVAPKKPEFLTIKEKENGTGVSVESQNQTGVHDGQGSSGESGSKETGKDNSTASTGVSKQPKEPIKRGRKPGQKVTGRK